MRRQALAIAAMLACPGQAAQAQVKLPSLSATRVQRTRVAPPTTAPDLKSTLYKMADVLGMLRGPEESESILTLEYWGTGTMSVGGQPYSLTTYRAGVRFNVPGMRVDFTRTGPEGQASQRQIQVVAGKFAWNETQPGTNATPAPGAVSERLLQIWTLPQGVVKAATRAGTNTKVTLEGGVVYVTFPLPAPLVGTAKAVLNTTDVMVLTLDNGNKYELTDLIDRVETRVGNFVAETTYSDYGDWNDADYKSDVWFPRHIVQKQGGVTTIDLTITRTNTYNPYVIMPVPKNVEQATAQQTVAPKQ